MTLFCSFYVCLQNRLFRVIGKTNASEIGRVFEMSDEVVQGVIDTIDLANTQRMQLTELLQSLEDAKFQVKHSARQSREKLKIHFEELKTTIVRTLDNRLEELESHVTSFEAEALKPLLQCDEIIKHGIHTTADVLDEGKKLLMSEHEEHLSDMIKFRSRADSLEMISLPEIPVLSEVAAISIDLPRGSDRQLEEAIKDYGRVMSRSPVQVIDVQERPGGLLVKWAEIEDEHALDLSEFLLQYCYGQVRNMDDSGQLFYQAYKGPATSYTVRNIKLHKTCTFRVCGRSEGAEVWSPWSVHAYGLTTLPHYEWRTSPSSSYITSNENQTGIRQESTETVSGYAPLLQNILYSKAPCYICGHCLVFKILEQGSCDPEDGLGLFVTDDCDDYMRKGVLFVNIQGVVYIDGHEKMTRLPALTRGSTVIFETEVLETDKVRVTVEVNEKIVTFDWVLKPGSPCKSPVSSFGFGGLHHYNNTTLYFGMKFKHPGWKVSVE